MLKSLKIACLLPGFYILQHVNDNQINFFFMETSWPHQRIPNQFIQHKPKYWIHSWKRNSPTIFRYFNQNKNINSTVRRKSTYNTQNLISSPPCTVSAFSHFIMKASLHYEDPKEVKLYGPFCHLTIFPILSTMLNFWTSRHVNCATGYSWSKKKKKKLLANTEN